MERFWILAVGLLAALSQPSAGAEEASDIQTELIAEVRENVSTTPGREVFRFVPARLLEQGQVVYYTVRITNQTTVPLRNVAVSAERSGEYHIPGGLGCRSGRRRVVLRRRRPQLRAAARR